MSTRRLTKPQIALLTSADSLFVTGPDVMVARRLEKRGLGELTDNGARHNEWGRDDRERWLFKLNADGRAERRKYRCPDCGMVADHPAFDHGERCGSCADAAHSSQDHQPTEEV